MSHCWNQDGNVFSTVCVVVIAVGIFTTLVSIFCVAKIFQMAKRIRQDHKNNTASDQIELQEYAIHIEPKKDDPDDITTVESSFVTTEESGNTTAVAGSTT